MFDVEMGQPGDCIIDTSTPETLERSFYAWLQSDPAQPAQFNILPSNLYPETVIPSLPIDQRPPPPPYPYPASVFYPISSDEGISSDSSLSPSSSSGSSPPTYHSPAYTYNPNILPDVTEAPEDQKPIINRFGNVRGRSSGTNQLGRMYAPGLPLSMADREQIVCLNQAGWKICDISKKLCVTHSCVSKILHRYRLTGSAKPKDAKESRPESEIVKAIRQYRNILGLSRQSDIRQQLLKDGHCTLDNVPSRSSINHILRTKLDLKKPKKK
uniref:Paired domain-containing protein n=1 Tax=Panagrellus redivivus TaxID=6233 RepID=A0A7E4ULM3_PANRE